MTIAYILWIWRGKGSSVTVCVHSNFPCFSRSGARIATCIVCRSRDQRPRTPIIHKLTNAFERNTKQTFTEIQSRHLQKYKADIYLRLLSSTLSLSNCCRCQANDGQIGPIPELKTKTRQAPILIDMSVEQNKTQFPLGGISTCLFNQPQRHNVVNSNSGSF